MTEPNRPELGPIELHTELRDIFHHLPPKVRLARAETATEEDYDKLGGYEGMLGKMSRLNWENNVEMAMNVSPFANVAARQMRLANSEGTKRLFTRATEVVDHSLLSSPLKQLVKNHIENLCATGWDQQFPDTVYEDLELDSGVTAGAFDERYVKPVSKSLIRTFLLHEQQAASLRSLIFADEPTETRAPTLAEQAKQQYVAEFGEEPI